MKRVYSRNVDKLYYYHRNTGTRIQTAFGTAEFAVEVARLDRRHRAKTATMGTLGHLIERYRATPGYLKPVTQGDYGWVRREFRKAKGMPRSQIDRPSVVARRKPGLRQAQAPVREPRGAGALAHVRGRHGPRADGHQPGRADQQGTQAHGLRHSMATDLRELGKTDREIADVLGQRTTYATPTHHRTADMKRSNARIPADLHGPNRPPKMENPSGKPPGPGSDDLG